MAFREKTTFVIGAGASAEFGMPVGTELAKLIKRSALIRRLGAREPMIGDSVFYDTFRRLWPTSSDEYREALKAAQIINEGVDTAVSIDAFIDRHNNNEMVARLGKMLIALEIAKAEFASSLNPGHWEQFKNDPKTTIRNSYDKVLTDPSDTWLGQFFRIMCDGVQDPTYLGKNLTIICFNYDRAIEHYLRDQIAAAYHIDLGEALEIVEGFNIIHPYGTLGKLPLMPSGYGPGTLAYAAKPRDELNLEEVAKGIRTYTQRKHDADVITKIHDGIAHARQIIFLGFGFNNQNLDLLRCGELVANYPQIRMPMIYSSGFGIAGQVENTLKRRILHLLIPEEGQHEGVKTRVKIEFGKTCSELFTIHNMNFSYFTRSLHEVNDVGESMYSPISSMAED